MFLMPNKNKIIVSPFSITLHAQKQVASNNLSHSTIKKYNSEPVIETYMHFTTVLFFSYSSISSFRSITKIIATKKTPIFPLSLIAEISSSYLWKPL